MVTGMLVLAYVLGGWFTVQEVFAALRQRCFQIDFLMLLAAGGAVVLGEWLQGALLLSLFTFGHALEIVASTINGAKALNIATTKIASGNTLARAVHGRSSRNP